MYLSRLELTNFRNFVEVDLRLPPGLVVIVGGNGQGKSNLLEAAYLLAIAKSYRANAERELIHRQAALRGDQAVVSGEAVRRADTLRVAVGLRIAPGDAAGPLVEKKVRINGAPALASDLVGLVAAVLFTAWDIDLVYGAPAQRRRFLDILLSQVDHRYLRALQRYQRVLAHRNHLLRQIREGRSGREEIDYWDGELAREGAAIVQRRQEAVGLMAPLVAAAYVGLSGNTEEVHMAYRPSVQPRDLAPALKDGLARETAAGMTLVGPHRDDVSLHVDDMEASAFASRGQARTLALALRLAEAAFLRSERGEEPVLLLDDVLSELDARRRQRVLEEAARYHQVLVTTAEAAFLRDAPVRPAATFEALRGRMEPRAGPVG